MLKEAIVETVRYYSNIIIFGSDVSKTQTEYKIQKWLNIIMILFDNFTNTTNTSNINQANII
jgi:hypothetical protein